MLYPLLPAIRKTKNKKQRVFDFELSIKAQQSLIQYQRPDPTTRWGTSP
jgi:hypothetical protein